MSKISPANTSTASLAHGLLIAALIGLCLLVLYAGVPDFPVAYHPDEPDKVAQVLEGWRNFHHPMLMLNLTSFVARLGGGELPGPQEIAGLGRLINAGWCALIGALLAFFGWRLAGLPAAIAVGLLFAMNDQILEVSQYFKEDPGMIAGIIGVLVVGNEYLRSRSLPALLGIALFAAVAVSTKYFGVLAVVLAVVILCGALLRRSGGSPPWHLAVFLVVFVGLTAVFNYQVLTRFDQFQAGLGSEVQKFEDEPTEAGVPHDRAINFVLGELLPLAWIPVLAFILVPFRRGPRLTFAEWLALALPLVVMLILTFSSRSSSRYMLPIGVMTPFFLGTGSVRLCAWLFPARPAARYGLLVVLVAGFMASNFGQFALTYASMSRDTRVELVAFIRQNLPTEAVIVYEDNLLLPDPAADRPGEPGEFLPQTVIGGKTYAADHGTLDELRARGVTHIAISEANFDQFERRRPQRKSLENFREIQKFYDPLFQSGDPLFSRDGGHFKHTEHGLRLYALPSKSVAAD